MTKKEKTSNSDHDGLLKKALEHGPARQELFEKHLPVYIKDLVDIKTLELQKESFIDEALKKSYSDLLFATPKNQYVYLLLENQSSVDNMMAFRLLKYMISICDMHMQKEPKPKKLPLIYPIIFYTGKRKYTAPRCIWDLFINPQLAEQCFAGEHQLIDLSSMTNDQLLDGKWTGILQYFMRHIQERDLLKRWQEIIDLLPHRLHITIDDIDESYLKSIIWYTVSGIETSQHQEFEALLKSNLNKKEDIMGSIAEMWENQGIEKGIQQGIQRGKAEGIAEGMEKEKLLIAQNMLANGINVDLVMKTTGLSRKQVIDLNIDNHKK